MWLFGKLTLVDKDGQYHAHKTSLAAIGTKFNPQSVKLFVPRLPKSLAKLLLKTIMSNITHKVQYSANHELLESTRNAEPVFKKVIQHFSSHNLFVLLVI